MHPRYGEPAAEVGLDKRAKDARLTAELDDAGQGADTPLKPNALTPVPPPTEPLRPDRPWH